MKKVKLAIADDHNLFRKGLIKLIHMGDKANKYHILFEAQDGNELKEKLDKNALPDIILVDIYMPDMDGYEIVSWLKENYPAIRILVISMFETEEAVLKMMRLGVKGYLSKDIEVEDMHKALEAISAGNHYYADFVIEALTNEVQEKPKASFTPADNWKALSDNEKIFLQLACTELTYAEIAEKMILSPKTIEGYRESLFAKFKVRNRVGLAMFAVRNGMITV